MDKIQRVADAVARSLAHNGFGSCSALPAHATAPFQGQLFRYRYDRKRDRKYLRLRVSLLCCYPYGRALCRLYQALSDSLLLFVSLGLLA